MELEHAIVPDIVGGITEIIPIALGDGLIMVIGQFYTSYSNGSPMYLLYSINTNGADVTGTYNTASSRRGASTSGDYWYYRTYYVYSGGSGSSPSGTQYWYSDYNGNYQGYQTLYQISSNTYYRIM